MFKRTIAAIGVLASMGWSAAAWADDLADFYRGKTVTMLIAAGAGGGYGLYGRMLAKYLPRHIPGNPNIILNFLPGAGGLKAAKKMAFVAPKDGSYIGIPLSSVVVAQLIQPRRVDFNVGDLGWLGTVAELNTVISVWHTLGIHSLEDAKKREIKIGATQKGSFLFQQPVIVNALLGTKFKPILGYKSTADLDVAIERGEVGGRAQFWASWQAKRPKWLAQGKLVHLLQVGKTKIKDLPNVPSLSQFVKTDRERAIVGFLHINTTMGRTLYAPPHLPAARLAALRKAVTDVTRDPEFLREMAKRKLPVQPGSGEELEAFVKEVLRTPPDVVAELRKTLGLK